MFSLNFFKPKVPVAEILDLKPQKPSKNQEINDLRRSFSAPFFAKLSKSGLNHYFNETISILDLSQDYITAYFAIKANPKAACLFSKEIQDKIASRAGLFQDIDPISIETDSDSDTIASDPANSTPSKTSPVHSPKEGTESVLDFDLQATAIVPFQEKISDTLHKQAQARYEKALKACLKTHLASQAFHASALKILVEPQATPSVAISAVPNVKIMQNKKEENTSVLNAQESLINCLKLIHIAKQTYVQTTILNSFASKAHNTVLGLLNSHDPVIKVLYANAASAPSASLSKHWIETLKAHIKIQPAYQFFLTKHRIEVAFLNSYTDDEQIFAKRALNHVSTQAFIQKQLLAKISAQTVLENLTKTLGAKIEKQTFITLIQNSFKGAQLEAALKLIQNPTPKILSAIQLTLGGDKSGRDAMRTLAFIQILDEINPKKSQTTSSIQQKIDTALRVATKYKNLEALHLYLSPSEIKLIPEKALHDLTTIVVNQRALEALGKQDKFAMDEFSSEQLACLRADLRTALTVLGFDLEGNDCF